MGLTCQIPPEGDYYFLSLEFITQGQHTSVQRIKPFIFKKIIAGRSLLVTKPLPAIFFITALISVIVTLIGLQIKINAI